MIAQVDPESVPIFENLHSLLVTGVSALRVVATASVFASNAVPPAVQARPKNTAERIGKIVFVKVGMADSLPLVRAADVVLFFEEVQPLSV